MATKKKVAIPIDLSEVAKGDPQVLSGIVNLSAIEAALSSKINDQLAELEEADHLRAEAVLINSNMKDLTSLKHDFQGRIQDTKNLLEQGHKALLHAIVQSPPVADVSERINKLSVPKDGINITLAQTIQMLYDEQRVPIDKVAEELISLASKEIAKLDGMLVERREELRKVDARYAEIMGKYGEYKSARK